MALLVIWVFALVAVVVGVFSIIIWLMLSEQRFKNIALKLEMNIVQLTMKYWKRRKPRRRKMSWII